MVHDVIIRTASPRDAAGIHTLIAKHAAEGRLLPRTLDEVTAHAGRFTVATSRGRVVACAELAPLGPSVAEVRSLVVGPRHRGARLGSRLVGALRHRARQDGYDELCAFAHDADYFARLGFSKVPHTRIPGKIEADCRRCALYGRCGQAAMLMELAALPDVRPQSISLRLL